MLNVAVIVAAVVIVIVVVDAIVVGVDSIIVRCLDWLCFVLMVTVKRGGGGGRL